MRITLILIAAVALLALAGWQSAVNAGEPGARQAVLVSQNPFDDDTTVVPAGATTVSLTGSQTRGTAGHNAELKCSSIKLAKGGTITSVNCSSAGFWITDDRGNVMRYDNPQSAVNVSLPAGTYSAYPNLPPGKDSAGVTVVIKRN